MIGSLAGLYDVHEDDSSMAVRRLRRLRYVGNHASRDEARRQLEAWDRLVSARCAEKLVSRLAFFGSMQQFSLEATHAYLRRESAIDVELHVKFFGRGPTERYA